MEAFEFSVYKSYLVQLAKRSGRPFRIPESYQSLETRNDYKLFLCLSEKLHDSGLTRRNLSKFFENADKIVLEFYVVNILKDYDEIIKIYNSVIEINDEDIKLKIIDSFNFLREYCHINNIKTYAELYEGNPPIILKLWKNKKIIEEILAVMFDFNNVKKKTWYRVYCGSVENNINKIRRNSRLLEFMNDELVRLKKDLNSTCKI